MDNDLLFDPGWGPEMYRDHVGDELEVCDAPQGDVLGDRAGEVFAEGVVETAEPGLILKPAVRRGVKGYVGFCGRYEKRYSIA